MKQGLTITYNLRVRSPTDLGFVCLFKGTWQGHCCSAITYLLTWGENVTWDSVTWDYVSQEGLQLLTACHCWKGEVLLCSPISFHLIQLIISGDQFSAKSTGGVPSHKASTNGWTGTYQELQGVDRTVQTRESQRLPYPFGCRLALVYETQVCAQAINYLNESHSKIHYPTRYWSKTNANPIDLREERDKHSHSDLLLSQLSLMISRQSLRKSAEAPSSQHHRN